MEKIVTEIYRWIKEKTSSPFLRYFTFSWIITNYSFLYFIFFQDEIIFFKINNISKTQYLLDNYFYWNIYCNISLFFILPILSGLFFLYLYPEINRYFLKEYMENNDLDEKEKQNYKINEIEREIERNKKRIEEKKIELEVKETEKEIKNIWNNYKEYIDEYYKIYDNKIFNEFEKIIEYSNLKKVIAKNEGFWEEWVYEINSDTLNKYISLGIILLNIKWINKYIQLSEKWQYFAKLYTKDKITKK